MSESENERAVEEDRAHALGVQIIHEVKSLLGASPDLVIEGAYVPMPGNPYGIFVQFTINRFGASKEENVRTIIRQAILSIVAESQFILYGVEWNLKVPREVLQNSFSE